MPREVRHPLKVTQLRRESGCEPSLTAETPSFLMTTLHFLLPEPQFVVFLLIYDIFPALMGLQSFGKEKMASVQHG